MSEVYDVTLDGVGYMLRPGSYGRMPAAPAGGRVGRVRLSDFRGGLRQALQRDRDRLWRASGALPDLDGQGVRPGPKGADKVESVSPAFNPANRSWSFAYNGTTYLVSGNALYRVSVSGGLYAGLVTVQTLAATVVDAVMVGTVIYACYGSSTNLSSYDLSSGSYTAAVAVTIGGTSAQRKARLLGVEGNSLVLVLASDTTTLSPQSDTPLTVGSSIRRLVQHDGHCWLVCDNGLYRMKDTATIVAESSFPQLGYADDAVWALSHLGQLFLWLGRQVVVYGSRADAVKDLSLGGSTRFAAGGLAGSATQGACSIGTWLVVALTNPLTGGYELWGHDGRGWWLLDGSGTDAFNWPASLHGAANDADLFAGRGVTSQASRVWQLIPNGSGRGYTGTMQVVSPLLDAGVLDVDKVWRRVGAELTSPELTATAGFSVSLEYSVDGGVSWTTAADQAYGTGARVWSLEAALAGAESRSLQLRATVSGVTSFAPALTGLWAEHETQDGPTRRRRWSFTVLCRDAVVKRDGSVDATGARQLALALWAAWASGDVVSFKDVDYDLTGTSYSVRVATVSEALAKPSQATTNADSDVLVQLVEV